ncbi:MAG TPA: cytochrome c3 family protein [Kofleriaceae bacterium]|jgi:hypothetical protein
MKRLLIPLAFVAALVAFWAVAARAQSSGDDWSPVVYPPQRMPITFSHAKHLARGATCAQCHAAAATSHAAADNLIPTERECRTCHAIDRANLAPAAKPGVPPVACAACHPGFDPASPNAVARTYLTPPPLLFDHAQHAKTACTVCHGDLTKVDYATARQLPTMSLCLTCHTQGAELRRCVDCHPAKLGGLVQTQFPHGNLVPMHDGLGEAHSPEFAMHHTQEARQPGATCNACHDQSECVACHQGTAKPVDFHQGDYVMTHAIDARRGKPDCSACHRYESFCVGCHERSGVATRGVTDYSSTIPGRQFHPAGWASSGPGPNRHASDARRNITACASCHREEDCLTCHSAESGHALRASPHPASWRGSARCKALDRGNRRMCLRCHVTKAELGCDWTAK